MEFQFGQFQKYLSRFSLGLGVDLGTVNSLVYVASRGVLIDEPSVVAKDQRHGEVLAVGEEALKMEGKTPPHIKAERPLTDGVISDFEITQLMLSYFIDEIQDSFFGLRPHVVVAVPQGATEVDRSSVRDALENAGARDVFLIEEPMAAAIGAGLPIKKAQGSFLIDIGGGTTEIAVTSLGGIVIKKQSRLGGEKLNEAIKEYVRSRFNLLIGLPTAERVKLNCGTVLKPKNRLEDKIRGRDLVKGLPREVTIDANQVFRALNPVVEEIINDVQASIEEIPPELIDDIMETGIVLTGGGSKLRGLRARMEAELDLPVKIADDPLTTVARGAGKVLENFDDYEETLI